MIEPAEPSPEFQGTDVHSGKSPGRLLKLARETAGMHIGTLAVTLKVPVKKLEALESDRWDLLPDAVFARALAASVCRTLKVDPAEVLEHLPATKPRLMPNDNSVNTPFHGEPGAGARSTVASHLSRPVGLAVLALMLGALGLIFWPVNQPTMVDSGADSSRAATSGGISTVVPSVSEVMPPPNQPAPSAVAVDSGSMDSTAAPSSSPSIALEPSRSPVLPVETTGNKPELKVGEPETIVMFKATGSSWIQVTDAKGTVVLKRLLGAGESAMATGQLPLAVLVGRVDATTVEIRGKPFDLASVARDNVARFEVKP